LDYHREIRRLWTEYPLFEKRPDIPTANLEDFVAEALLLPSMLQESDPVSFFILGEFLHQSLQMEDDGSASFLLIAGQQILRILEEPIRTQTYLRNIFEMTFDGTERASQRERFEKLRSVYPDVARLCDPALLDRAHTNWCAMRRARSHLRRRRLGRNEWLAAWALTGRVPIRRKCSYWIWAAPMPNGSVSRRTISAAAIKRDIRV